jgi:hypothetical protein
MTFLLRVPVGCGNIPRRSGDHLENDGKTHILPQGDEERANVAILEARGGHSIVNLNTTCGGKKSNFW